MVNHADVIDVNIVRIIASTFKDIMTREGIIADASAFVQMCFALSNELMKLNGSIPVLNNEYVSILASVSPIHDIGKAGIPEEILNKPGALTEDEMNIVKKHPEIGRNMIRFAIGDKDSLSYRLASEVTLCHHERWEGSGYPNKMKGNEIPLSARIVSVVDVYHALRSNRCYKDALPHEKSMEIICEGVGSHFDPLVVAAFLNVSRQFDDIFSKKQGHAAKYMAFM